MKTLWIALTIATLAIPLHCAAQDTAPRTRGQNMLEADNALAKSDHDNGIGLAMLAVDTNQIQIDAQLLSCEITQMQIDQYNASHTDKEEGVGDVIDVIVKLHEDLAKTNQQKRQLLLKAKR